MLKCVEMIRVLRTVSGTGTGTGTAANVGRRVPPSPNGVLEAACLSYKSDERAVGSCPNSSRPSPDSKKRRLDTPTKKN